MTSSDVVTVSYQELLDFDFGSVDTDNNARTLVEKIGRAYGNDGLGILAVTGVPDFTELRQRLLPLAAKLPNLPKDDLTQCIVEEACYAVGWSHGKEELIPGVPDLSKGSFYANPLVNDLYQAMLEREMRHPTSETFKQDLECLVKANPAFFAPNVYPKTLPELEGAIADMGQCIAKVGRLVARVCQTYCTKQGVMVELENILKDSLNCKARLLHYFNATNNEECDVPFDEKKDDDKRGQWWCGWHNDHGSLTGLVPALYLSGDGKTQVSNPPDPSAGLYIQSRAGRTVQVNLPSDCLGFQIGETFQILSGGILQATPHAVKQSSLPGWTRETYAVFLEPEYHFAMTIPEGLTVDDCCPEEREKANEAVRLNSIKTRWKLGMTFGEFNNITIAKFHSQEI